MAANTEALNDPNYNPELDDLTLKLYSMMDEPSDELYAQYRQVFDNLPSVSPYSGVLVNPNTCDINDINNSVAVTVKALQDYGNQNYPNDPTWHTEIIDPSNPDSAVSQLTGGDTTVDPITGEVTYTQPNSVIPNTNNAQDYTDKLLSNLPMILGIVQQALGLATALEGLLNPCLGVGDFLGSLKGDLNKILKKIKSAIDDIMNFIEDGIEVIKEAIQAVKDAIAKVMGFITDMVNFIEAEVKKLIKALIDSIKLALSGFLKSLHLDPCLKGLVGGITTMAVTALL